MTVAQILREKGNQVIAARADQPVIEIATLLRAHRIGAVLIMEETHILGVLSERDIVRSLAEFGASALDKPASELMTKEVKTCRPEETVADVMGRMTAGRFRHLPVMEDNRLAGMISIGDVVKRRIAETEEEAEILRDYITAS